MTLVKTDPVLSLKIINTFGSDKIKQRQLGVGDLFYLSYNKYWLMTRLKCYNFATSLLTNPVLIVYISSTDYSKIISLKDSLKPTSVISRVDWKITLKTRNI